jgi:DNA modification methylase
LPSAFEWALARTTLLGSQMVGQLHEVHRAGRHWQGGHYPDGPTRLEEVCWAAIHSAAELATTIWWVDVREVMTYSEFLQSKSQYALPVGFQPSTNLCPRMFPFQKAITLWALNRGRAAVFADCGLGKTLIEQEWARQVHRYTGKPILIFAPLAVSDQMVREGKKFGIPVVHAHLPAELEAISATNYERLHLFAPPDQFGGLILDESSILKSADGKTRTALIQYAKAIPYRLAATATPAPNDFMELGNHAEFLDVLSRAEMLATFFTHDGGETAKWRLKGHAKKPFWKWVASWAVALRKPSDLGFEDNGFLLPPLKILSVEVEDDYKSRGRLISVEAVTLEERRDVRRQTIPQRVSACADLVSKQPKEPWLIWCNLNAEGDALRKAIPDSFQVSGSDSEAVKEKALNDFSLGRIRVLITKPTIAGFGMNWQHCCNVVFVGLSDSYEQFYQAIRRCWRFGQTRQVSAWVITSASEGAVVRNIKRKELQADEMMNGIVTDMKSEVVKNLSVPTQHQSEALRHDSVKTKRWTAVLGDCTDEVKAIPEASIDYCIFSPPFSSLYTYTSSLRDMGNCRNDAEFFQHFDFLVPELLRVMKPGRLVSVHCANLTILKSRSGYIGLRDFRGELIWLLQRAGFIFHSEVCIWKDPLVAMQRSKALGLLHKQIVKDSSFCIQGTPDYLITFRKPGDNAKPITHKPNGFQSYIGEQAPKVPKHPVAAKNKFSHEVWQRYASPVWTDISQSKTLQYRAAREQNDERHIAPLQLQVVERALELWSKPNDLVLSPFMGIGTEGYVALKTGRRFIGVELKPSYWSMAVKNLKYAETHSQIKRLF